MNVFETLQSTSQADSEVLGVLDSHGDVSAISRDVEFEFLTNDRSKADAFAGYINDNKYAKAEVKAVGDDFGVTAGINMPVTQAVVSTVSGFMAFLGILFQVEYDGWISPVAKASS
jgi:hypothetical protein